MIMPWTGEAWKTSRTVNRDAWHTSTTWLDEWSAAMGRGMNLCEPVQDAPDLPGIVDPAPPALPGGHQRAFAPARGMTVRNSGLVHGCATHVVLRNGWRPHTRVAGGGGG